MIFILLEFDLALRELCVEDLVRESLVATPSPKLHAPIDCLISNDIKMFSYSDLPWRVAFLFLMWELILDSML